MLKVLKAGTAMKNSSENKERLDNIHSRLKKSNVVDMSFSGSGEKVLDYMEDVLNVLDDNQEWLDENAKKKAAKYQ